MTSYQPIISSLSIDDYFSLSQIQEFAADPQNRDVLEMECLTLLQLLDPIIDDAVEKESDFGLPRTIAAIGKQPIRARYLGHVTGYQPIRL